jgi:hypothetical protein
MSKVRHLSNEYSPEPHSPEGADKILFLLVHSEPRAFLILGYIPEIKKHLFPDIQKNISYLSMREDPCGDDKPSPLSFQSDDP